jgi:beta-phosphoglucomutase-like phosphatase (HAD superfamily)
LAIATGDDVVVKNLPDVYLHAAHGVAGMLPVLRPVARPMAAAAAGMTVVAVVNHVTQTLNYSQAATLITNLEQVTVDWIETFKEATTNVQLF